MALPFTLVGGRGTRRDVSAGFQQTLAIYPGKGRQGDTRRDVSAGFQQTLAIYPGKGEAGRQEE